LAEKNYGQDITEALESAQNNILLRLSREDLLLKFAAAAPRRWDLDYIYFTNMMKYPN